MALAQLAVRTTDALNLLAPNDGWQYRPWPDNLQPWVRIFNRRMVQQWPANTKRSYPIFWFEIKCINKRTSHDGNGPYSIYVALEHAKTAASYADANTCLDHMVNQLETIEDEDLRHSLSESLDIYRQQPGRPKRCELDPRLILDDSYFDTAVGYILIRKQLFA